MKDLLVVPLLLLSCFATAQTLSSKLPGAAVVELDIKNGIVKDEAPVPYGARLIFKGQILDTITKIPLDTLFALHKQSLLALHPHNLWSTRKDSLLAVHKDSLLALHKDTLYAFFNDTLCDIAGIVKTVPNAYTSIGGWARPDPTIAGQQQVAEFLSALNADQFFLANRNYCLLIRRISDRNKLDSKQQFISLRTASKFADYVKLDFGVGYSFPPKALFGTVTAHFYLFPTNEFINLAEHFSFSRQFFMRTSLFVGIAPVMLSSNTKQDIKPRTGVGNVVFGLGLRAPFFYPKHDDGGVDALFRRALTPKGVNIKNFMQAIRLNLGWIIFKQADPSPFISKDRTKIEPYVSLTYDASLKDLLAPIALLLGLK